MIQNKLWLTIDEWQKLTFEGFTFDFDAQNGENDIYSKNWIIFLGFLVTLARSRLECGFYFVEVYHHSITWFSVLFVQFYLFNIIRHTTLQTCVFPKNRVIWILGDKKITKYYLKKKKKKKIFYCNFHNWTLGKILLFINWENYLPFTI